MEKSCALDFPVNGKPQMESDHRLQNGSLVDDERTCRLVRPTDEGILNELKPSDKHNAESNVSINGGSGDVNPLNECDRAESLKSTKMLADDCPKTSQTSHVDLELTPDVNFTSSKLVKSDLETTSENDQETCLNNARKKLYHCDSKSSDCVTFRLLESISDCNMDFLNEMTDIQKFSEDSRLLENRVGEEQDSDEMDDKMDEGVLDLKSLAADVDRSVFDEKKAQRTKTTDSCRPFARLLHNLGQELVRQLVYKDLVEIQESKDVNNKLDEKEKGQLVKLMEAYANLCSKNDVYKMPSQSCRCGFMSSSANVMALHREFGHSVDQFPHVCCYCDGFKSKWPSQFIAHMETVHGVKPRIQKKLAPNSCFFCPYEHKNWMKIELHMSKCGNKFSLSSNLQPQPADCDIPVLQKPGQAPRNFSLNQPALGNVSARFPVPNSNPVSSALAVTPGQSSVMEIDGQLYSLVNHNGKVLLTSLRSQIGGSPSTGAVIPSAASAGKIAFAPSVKPPQPPRLDPVKSAAPVHRETCEICDFVVSNREALWTHFRDVHRVELSRTSMREQEPWMKCTFCTSRFWTYQGLARHSLTHHNRNIAPLPQAMNSSRSPRCYLCGNSQTSNPLNHFSTFHNITLLDMYQSRHCCMCNRRLKQPRFFEEHMIFQHRDIFANSEVLHTVIQALSSAYHLKTDDGILQRPPLMVQQLQQNVSGVGTTTSSAKIVSSSKLISSTSTVYGSRAALNMGLTAGVRTTSNANMVSGLKMFPGAAVSPSMRMVSGSGAFSGMRAMSNASTSLGMKADMRTSSAVKMTSFVGSASSDKFCSTNMRNWSDRAKLISASNLNAAKAARLADCRKSKVKNDAVDRSKAKEQTASPVSKIPKKTREEEEKDFNKLYEELSDIGRPILRSMRHRLTQGDEKCKTLKRPAESTSEKADSENQVKVSCSDEKCDGKEDSAEPAAKMPRFEDNVESTEAQESLSNSEVSVSLKTDSAAEAAAALVPVAKSEIL